MAWRPTDETICSAGRRGPGVWKLACLRAERAGLRGQGHVSADHADAARLLRISTELRPADAIPDGRLWAKSLQRAGRCPCRARRAARVPVLRRQFLWPESQLPPQLLTDAEPDGLRPVLDGL